MIVDANTGAILQNTAGDEIRHPASLTKMMTLYMAFEAIHQGRLSYQTKIKVSQEAASAAPSKLELEPGEEIALIDAIKALVTKSANDMAVAIAERIGGTEANFARLMTAKARQLGMTRTHFNNASGLPDPGQVTTARDMITLALHLQDDYPRDYPLFALKSFTYAGSSYRNHNTLLYSYRGTDGIKTGYTRMSGFNLVASVHRDGKHLVGAIFGGSSAAARNVMLKALLDRAFTRASTRVTRRPVLIAKPTPVHRPRAKSTAVAAVAPLVPPKPNPVARTDVRKAERPPFAPAAQRPAAPTLAASVAPQQPAIAPSHPSHASGLADEPVAAEAAPETPIHIARVHRVLVAPRVNRAQVAVTPRADEGRDYGSAQSATSFAPPTRDDGSAPARAQGFVETASAASTTPDGSNTTFANSQPGMTMSRLVASVAGSEATTPQPLPEPTGREATRGKMPSTLGAQAARLANGGQITTAALADGPTYRLHGPTAQPAAAGGYQIQVGAYGSAAEAEQRLATLRQTAGPVVGSSQGVTLPVQKGNRQLFRARFAGFSATSAAQACTELRRQAIDCYVNKAE
jgi:D-alanyl-D-alanine carboxypeptidase